MDRAILLAQLQ
jgi:predicted P-loop ATPase